MVRRVRSALVLLAVLAGTLALAGGALAARAAAADPGPQPLPGEWWFPAWEVQQKVWPLTEGAGVTVAVLDTGVQANLPDLRGAVVPGGDVTGAGTDGMTDTNTTEDGHGTAMAALIVGQGRGPAGTGLAGIAPKAKVMPVRTGSNGGGTPQTIAAGIRFAVNHGARVINMSFGGPTPTPYRCDGAEQDAVAYALQHTVVVVAAAGNFGNAGNPSLEPASCAGVLTAGGVNPDGSVWQDSERQPYVTVAAPGNYVGFLGRDGRYFPHGYGTSSASAFVSGAAALVRSRYPRMPWYRVVSRLINTALPRGKPVPNDEYGYGIVALNAAVDAPKFPVPASAPNPVYAAYKRWLASPQGRKFTAAKPSPGAAHRSPRAVHRPPAAAPASPSGESPALPAGIAAAVVAAAGAGGAVAVSRRRRSRHAASPGAPAGPGDAGR
jgi:membrane-anchored mycosin MYCP